MKQFGFIIILFFYNPSFAQNKLSLEEAVQTMLKNSFEIQIAKNNLEISKINNHLGTAGGLPIVAATLNDNQQIISVNQKLNNGTSIQRNGASSNNFNMGVTASILLYNGYRVYATKNRLSEIEKMNEQLLNAQIQNSIAAIMIKYYDIVRQESYLKTIQASIDVSTKRIEIVEGRQQVGMANNADLFQAKIDLNTRLQELESQILIKQQATSDLNKLMGLSQSFNFYIKDSIIVDKFIKLDSVIQYVKSNYQLIVFEQQIRMNEWAEKEVAAQRYPAVRLSTGYNYIRNQSAAGFTLLNQNYGPFIGLNVQVPIFNGQIVNRQQKTSALATNISRLEKNNLLNELETTVYKSWQAYSNLIKRLDVEYENFNLSEKLLKLVFQKFELNQASFIDLREAQKSFEDAGYRLTNLAYAARMNEIELKRISNQLSY